MWFWGKRGVTRTLLEHRRPRKVPTVLESAYSVFRHLAIERAKPPPTSDEIAAIETLLGARLPRLFVEFLQVANGGSLEYVIDVPVGDVDSEQLSFSAIFSTENQSGRETFLDEIRTAREHAKVPKGVLPFARNGGGSMAYLDLSKDGGGRRRLRERDA